ncbi:MAG TPA: nuclear transport factor 2 family protein [Pseudonocardia sp.]
MTSNPLDLTEPSTSGSAPEVVSELLLRNLTQVFDERDGDRRRTAIAELWAPDAVFVDPMGRFTGHAALDAAIAELHSHTPAHRFAAVGAPSVHAGGGLLNWSYGPDGDLSRVTGQDVAVVAGGKIVALYTYLDTPAPSETANDGAGVRETVESFFRLLGEGDADRVAELFAEEVDWLIPGNENLPWIGRRSDRRQIPEVIKIIGSLHVPGKSEATIEKVLVDGSDAVALGRFAHTVTATGRPYSMLVAFHFTVENGQIVRMNMYEDTYLVSTAFEASD